MRNVFTEIIEAIDETTKEHNRNDKKRSKLDKASVALLFIGCAMAVIGCVLLYLIYEFFPSETSLTTAKSFMLIVVLLGMTSLMLSILAIILDHCCPVNLKEKA